MSSADVGEHKLSQECSNMSFKQLKENVIYGLKNCADGIELDVLNQIVRPQTWELKYHCKQVKHDLHCFLQPLGITKIELFGSIITGLMFRG